MKYCEEYAALLDLFVDGELPASEMERVQAHLGTCPGCQSYVDDALAIRAEFPDVEDTIVPEGLSESVMERVRRDAEKKSLELRRRSIRRWAGTFGALAACCALVIFMRTGSGGGSNSAAMVTASGRTASADCAMDTGETFGTTCEAGIAPQMAMEPAAASEAARMEDGEAPIEGLAEIQMTAGSGKEMDAEELEKAASRPAHEDLMVAGSPAETAQEAAEDTAVSRGRAALYLSAEEAGEFLGDFVPVWEDAVSWGYELNAGEYQALLVALGKQEEPPETESGTFLVVVTGCLE